MGNMRPELFRKLAACALEKYDPSKSDNAPSQNASGITNGDIKNIENFKSAVFAVLMLRAAEFVAVSRQETKIADPKDRFAVTSVKLFLSDNSIHAAQKTMLLNMNVIPRAMAPDLFDTDEITEICGKFGGRNPEFFLACD
ncbi:MAG: hypothetical protein ACKVS5_02740 [Parvularculaceae bacterium]